MSPSIKAGTDMNFTIVTDSDIRGLNDIKQVKIQDLVLHNAETFRIKEDRLEAFQDKVLFNLQEVNFFKYARIIEALVPITNYNPSVYSQFFVDSFTFASIEALQQFILSSSQTWDCEGFVLYNGYENLDFALKVIFDNKSTITIREHKEELKHAFIYMGKISSLLELNEQQKAICQKLVENSNSLVAVVYLSNYLIYKINTFNPITEAEHLGFEIKIMD